ncbi:hypothetical protein AUK40_01260 [Candidatus Wirthbacteria bacterium CG2_30_54_11]|uniref:DUF948 domain-containing protein n=1 Tax=Candidatus Wirthbacteria bacterium CG2_30_54_11 TaxID=1817892 RepID=A0A1J5J042_9BACT|nr:MAG: hypothetical protein AUK40_01260 [Candidatus Wirthbacteria bacterium CG2_30_54_11]
MTITQAVLIGILIAFTLNLLFLMMYIGPILTQVRDIVKDAREITDVVKNRVKKVDGALDKLSGIMNIFDKIATIASKFGGSGKKDPTKT